MSDPSILSSAWDTITAYPYLSLIPPTIATVSIWAAYRASSRLGATDPDDTEPQSSRGRSRKRQFDKRTGSSILTEDDRSILFKAWTDRSSGKAPNLSEAIPQANLDKMPAVYENFATMIAPPGRNDAEYEELSKDAAGFILAEWRFGPGAICSTTGTHRGTYLRALQTFRGMKEGEEMHQECSRLHEEWQASVADQECQTRGTEMSDAAQT